MTNCTCTEQGNPHVYGLALQLVGAGTVADRCRVYGAACEGLGVDRRGAVSVTDGATLRNSLVAGCRAAVCCDPLTVRRFGASRSEGGDA